MTVPRWDAQQWHKQQNPTPAPKPRMKMAVAVAAVALCLGAAAVSATAFGDDEKVGICHATGSTEGSYVFLIVDRKGYEHGHHRHHGNDFFVAPDAGGCEGDVYEAAADNAPADDAPADDGANSTERSPADNGTTNTPAVPDDGTAPGDNATAGNGTVGDEPSGNATEGPANETRDAWVRQMAIQEGDLVTILLDVGNAGNGDAAVGLTDDLPDVRRTWHLGGTDASACVLEERALSCWFGQLAPGQTRQVELRAYTDRMPCGFSLTNTAEVGSEDDAQLRNNASSASILARPC